MWIVWNKAKTVGVVCKDAQLSYELCKGALNSLGIVSSAFMDAWAEMTADDVCTIEELDTWIEWHGGGCPVDAESLVDVKIRNGAIWRNKLASEWGWAHFDCHHDIVAYRVVK